MKLSIASLGFFASIAFLCCAAGLIVSVAHRPLPLELTAGLGCFMMAGAITPSRRRGQEERVTTFSTLGRRLSAVRTAKEAAQIVVDAADTLCGWDACVPDLCSPGEVAVTTVLCLDTIDGRRKEIVPETISPNVSPMAQRVIQQGAQLILRDTVKTLPSTTVAFGDKSRPSASLMYVPVKNEKKVVGVLSIQSYTPKAYDEQDLANLQALADHCSGALERVWAEAALQEANERLRLALLAGKMGTWTNDLGSRHVTLSPELEAIFGVPEGEATSTEAAFFEFIHPEDRAAVRQAFARSVESKADYEVEFRFQPRDRPSGWMLGRGRAHYDAVGKPLRLAGVAIDITARKEVEGMVNDLNSQLEQRVRERTAELEAINQELEAFAYSVSHDLRAPLRGIRGFSDTLLERYGPQFDAQGRDFLKRICDASGQMDRLIEDLLKLSRASLSDLSRQPVDLSVIAEAIVADLRMVEPERKVTIVIEADLRTEGDERLLAVVIENLLRNAWKFTGKRADAKMEFGFTTIPERAFFVRDNGAGFDMAYADKLFGVFQRLHSVKEFSGTGVGLATVQRIVKRHGGRVWASGVVNGGATFYFTLPGRGTLHGETDAARIDR